MKAKLTRAQRKAGLDLRDVMKAQGYVLASHPREQEHDDWYCRRPLTEIADVSVEGGRLRISFATDLDNSRGMEQLRREMSAVANWLDERPS